MADCAGCGARIEDGITRCPQCGASLARRGSLLQIGGWVVISMSSIPLVVGVISAQQENYIPLGIGIAVLLAGVGMIIVGRIQMSMSPDPVRPSAPPASAPPSGAPPSGASPAAAPPPR